MRLRPASSLRLLASFGVLSLLSAGCTDEKIVYREPFNPPPDAEAGFVGYFTTSDKSTTCGNCHVDHENKWVGTAHADAYAGLGEQWKRVGDLLRLPYRKRARERRSVSLQGGTSSRTRPITTCSARAATGREWITSRPRMPRRPRWHGSGCSRPTSQPGMSTRIRPPSRAPAPSVTAGRITPSSTSGGCPATRGNWSTRKREASSGTARTAPPAMTAVGRSGPGA